MIKLLALEQDVQRVQRVFSDTVDKMIKEIQSGKRKVKCDQEVSTSTSNALMNLLNSFLNVFVWIKTKMCNLFTF